MVPLAIHLEADNCGGGDDGDTGPGHEKNGGGAKRLDPTAPGRFVHEPDGRDQAHGGRRQIEPAPHGEPIPSRYRSAP